MIYKFEDLETHACLEIEHIESGNVVNFMIENGDIGLVVNLNRKDVFKLIGALHLLHKEMKDE